MDNIIAYAVFDLPVTVVARQLRRFFGIRHRQADHIASALVTGAFAAAVAGLWWGYAR